ncbi:DUF6541 family protein [Deinococcus peraridilitoris]|uniref:Uncharacterized protein n=1 Tax=Deinococcus peraridilitoris (strain DSM 19664 / LMG 22246 / CIP 109416 / KR-200) TaxID=937777 RepID=L0A1Y1_DEIPD|nr:DUF6541 family protein [Deinococcus peraridilitoris]AFZ67162.1 hypothetical protein Deipe_1625 [Deinococcus peraridilitoris DSM 19664]
MSPLRVGLSVAAGLLLAPIISLALATVLSIGFHAIGLKVPNFVPFLLSWVILTFLLWQLLKRPASPAQPSDRGQRTSQVILWVFAVTWLIGMGFLALVMGTLATDSGTSEARQAGAVIIAVGLLIAVTPPLVMTFLSMRRRKHG